MKSIVRFTIRQAVFVNVAFVILVVAGGYSVITTPLENMPLVDMGEVFIRTVYFGASAEDVEKLVTTKVEEALDGLENVEYIQSDSYRNFSSVKVKFIDDSDYESLYKELRFRVLNIKNELPAEVDEPTFLYIDTNLWLPVVVVNISGNLPQRSLKLFGEELKTQLLKLPDVRNAQIEGEFEPEFHVALNPEKLRRFGVTFQQVGEAIRTANTKIPTGRFRKTDAEFMLDAGRRLDSQQAVLDIIVRRDGDGNFVRVRDVVAGARLSHRDPTMIPSVNGDNTIRIMVTKEEQGNAVSISRQVKALAKRFEERHRRDGIQVVFTNDSVIAINDSLKTLGGNLLLGMALVIGILWVTLGFRNAVMAAVGIPFSFLCTIILMKLTGVSLNTISLFAFVLVTGIMVDDAVIIVENIYRHYQMGKAKAQAVIDGTAEVMLPVISAAVTTVLAFLPMLIMTGTTGEFFSYIPKTVTFALLASLLEALFILPIHFLDWGPKRSGDPMEATTAEDPFAHLRAGLFAPFWRLYRRLVEALLNHKVWTFTVMTLLLWSSVAVLILSATGVMPLIKVEFFPGNYFRYHVTVATPVGTSIEKTDAIVRDVSRLIMSLGQGQAQSTAGSTGFYEDEDYIRHTGSNFGQIVVTLPEQKYQDFPENPANDPMQHLEFIRRTIQSHVEANYGASPFKPVIGVFEESDGPPTGKAVNIRVTAMTIANALEASDRILAYMRTETELADLIGLGDDRPEFHKTLSFVPRQEAVYEYDLHPGDVTRLLAGALYGMYSGDFRTTDEEIDLLVRIARDSDTGQFSATALSAPEEVLNLVAIEDSTAPVFFRDLVKIRYKAEPNVLSRYKGKPTLTITADIRPGSRLSPARVKVLVSQFFETIGPRMPGVSLSYGGEFESTSKSYRSLVFAFFIAVLAIYLVLSSQFKDYIQPLIIIAAVPYALIGVVVGLFLTRTTFTVGSFLAIIGLAGIAVNDALLLIDFINARARQNKGLREAILEACAARMRPVIITTITTMLGLLPMAFGIPNRSISWAPMATAFVAGLTSATFLTLLITPANYELAIQFKDFTRRFGRRTLQPFAGRRD
jgi:HAE1 family hydrophobic/amphiphilic exporter-1